MKTKTPLHRIAALFAFALLATFGATHEAKAQTLFVLSSSNYTQNFNSLGSSAATNVPTGWFATTNSTNFTATGGTNVTVAYGTAGTGAVTGTSGGGVVNWGSGTNATATDRALGFLNTGTYTTGKSLVFGFTNSTGSSVTNLSLAWDYEKYRSGTRAWTWTFAYSTNGSSWITNSSGGLAYAADANNNVVNPPTTTTNISLNIGSLSIGNGSSVYLRWTLDGNGGSSNGQGLAVDNFSMTASYSAIIAGTYWAPGAGGGGNGTWGSGNDVWATAAGTQGTGPQAAAGTLIFGNSAGTVTVSGAVSAVAGLQFSTDGYTVTGGTSISLTGANAAANTITTDASVGATINTVLAGTASMTKAGTGTLTLGGANTYTGGTTVSGGRLVGDTTSLRGNITNNAALTFNQSTNGAYSDVISGTGSVVKSGAGQVTLSGANSYSGGTTVNGGALIGDTRSLQGNIANTAAVTFSQTTNGTYAGVISGTGGTVTKSGAGTVTFTQNNTYTGATTVSGGRLVVNGSQSSSAVTVNSGASLAGSGTVGGLTVSGLLAPGTSIGTLSAGSTTFNGGGSLELEIFDWVNVAGTGWDLFAITGDLTLNNTSGSPFTINLVSLANSTTPGLSTDWDQNVSFTNTFVTVSGSLLGTPFASNLFTVNTNGFQNTVNGTFSITNVGNNLALLYTTSFVPATEYIWNTGAGAWGTGGSWSGGVAPSNNSAIIFSGAGGASTNNLVNTVQSLLFSNSAGSYTVSGDALTVGALGIDNESTAAQNINNNLTLGGAQTFLAANGDLTIGGTVNNADFLLTVAGAANTTINGAISGAGGLTKNGAGSLMLAGANSYAGGTTINAGAVVGSTISLQGNIANASFLEFSQAGDGTYGGAISGAGLVTKSGAGNVTFSGANSYSGGTIISGGTLTGSTASVPGDVDVSSGATFALDQPTNGTFSGLIEGVGRFVKAGSGNVTLDGANTYSGGTLVNGGTLTGTTTSLQGNITNNAAIVFNQAAAGTYSGAMSGSGSLTKSGAGSLTLSGANSYSGGTLVSAGALVGSTASLQGTITNNAAVVISQTTNGTYSGAMSGSGGFTKSGSGTVTLGGNNSGYNGAIDLQTGGLVAAHNNALGSSAVTMTNGSIQAASGVTVSNNFNIGVAGGVTTNAYSSTIVAGWDFSTNTGGLGNFGPSPMGASTNASGVSIAGLTRGSGVGTNGSGAAAAWGGDTWSTNSSAATAITDGDFATFAVTVSNGFALSLTNFAAYNVRRSSSGPTTGLWQWSTNGVDFTDIGSAITWGSTTTAVGNAQNAISLTNINQLQALGSGSTVTFRVVNYGASGTGTWYLNTTSGGSGTALDFLVNGQIATVISNAAIGTGTLGISEAGTANFSGNIANNSSAIFTAASGGTATFSGIVSGAGTLNKTGAGTVTLSGASANTFTGTTTVSAGTLQLNKTAGVTALSSTNLIVSKVDNDNRAVLLLSANNQVADTTAVTLSGGTIRRGGNVSEIFGSLNLTEGSFLDYGADNAIGTLTFAGTYTPSALLTVQNFLPGSKLQFGSTISSADLNNTSLFSFSNGFTTGTEGGYFTITAIPEPSTYLAAAGLLSLMLWPSRKRIIRDTKKILGLTPPMRDRLANRAG